LIDGKIVLMSLASAGAGLSSWRCVRYRPLARGNGNGTTRAGSKDRDIRDFSDGGSAESNFMQGNNPEIASGIFGKGSYRNETL
jgi:hypothetical protein